MPTKQRLIYSSAQKTKKIEKSEENAKQFTNEGGRPVAATTSEGALAPGGREPRRRWRAGQRWPRARLKVLLPPSLSGF